MIIHGITVLFFASSLVVKQDQAPLRSGCEARDEVVAGAGDVANHLAIKSSV